MLKSLEKHEFNYWDEKLLYVAGPEKSALPQVDEIIHAAKEVCYVG